MIPSDCMFLGFWAPSPAELIIIMVIALLLFGKRLPEVARSMGKGVVEFKKGLKGIEDDMDQRGGSSTYQAPRNAPPPNEWENRPSQNLPPQNPPPPPPSGVDSPR